MYPKSIAVGAVAMGLAAMLDATPATAQTFDHLTYLTFSGPVKVPRCHVDARHVPIPSDESDHESQRHPGDEPGRRHRVLAVQYDSGFPRDHNA
jgi:hypothetical protein